MKNIIKYLAIFHLLSVYGCNDNTCTATITLNESFIAQKDCEYICLTDDGEIIIEITAIEDEMVYGTACQTSTGGSAEITININFDKKKHNTTFMWPGCDGTTDYSPTLPSLPSFKMKDYTLKMTKLYPLTPTQDAPPASQNDYEIKLIILD